MSEKYELVLHLHSYLKSISASADRSAKKYWMMIPEDLFLFL